MVYIDVFQVDIYSLSRKWKELVDKARAKQLQPHEYNSGLLLHASMLTCPYKMSFFGEVFIFSF